MLTPKLKHARIRTRIFLFIMIAILACTLMVAALCSALFAGQLREQSYIRSQELLTGACRRVESFMRGIDTTAYALMYSKNVQAVLGKTLDETVYTQYNARLNLNYVLSLQQAVRTDCKFVVYPLTQSEGSYVMADGDRNGSYRFELDAWYARLASGARKAYIVNDSTRYRARPARTPAHIAAYRVNNLYSLQDIGYLCIYIEPESVAELVRGLSDSVRNLALVDDSGSVLFAQETELSASQLMKLSEDGSSLVSAGRNLALMERRLSGLPWRIVCTVDNTDVVREYTHIAFVIFGMAILITALLLPVAYRFSIHLVEPIERLIIGMQNVSMGRLDFSLPSAREDELGVLTRNFNSMVSQLNEANQRLALFGQLQREMELNALRQQINPHFLYNTLDMIIGMTTEGKGDEVILVCKNLAGMFRYNLSGPHTVALARELEQIERYLTISKCRFGERFEVRFQVDEALSKLTLPKFVLQPFVENSILHGFSSIRKAGLLTIGAQAGPPGGVRLWVEDNGAGIPQATLAQLREALSEGDEVTDSSRFIGMRNVYLRMRLEYGESFRMDIMSRVDAGTRVEMWFPQSPQGGSRCTK